MQELTFQKIADSEALHQQMKAALMDVFVGVSITGETVVVHLNDNITPQQIAIVNATVAAHDVTTLPPKPIQKTHDQRFAELEARITTLEQSPPNNPGSTLP
jgi:hypothetical protein